MAQQSQSQSHQQSPEVRNPATFQTAILATAEGKTVKVIGLGDVEGMSPAYLCVDTQGRSQWRAIREVVIVDPLINPSTQLFTQTLGGGQGSSSKQTGGAYDE